MSGEFYALTRDAARILVIEPGQLGDTIHLLPALWDLRHNYSRAEIHVVCSPVGAEILGMAGCVDRLWVLEQSRAKRSLSGQLEVLRALRKLRFDASINFGDHDRNVIHAAFVSAKHRLCFGNCRHFWSRWCIRHWISARDPSMPVYDQRRRFLAEAGFPVDKAPRFGLRPPESAEAWAEANLASASVHLSINASSPFKEWPIRQWADLAIRLRESGHSIVVTATSDPREGERAAKLALKVGMENPQFLVGLDIPKLAALLSRCRLHIGADSGALHLAMALGLPTVGVFRDYPGRSEWTPAATPHRQVSRPCPCVGRLQDNCRDSGQASCLAGIPPEEVFAECRKLLEGEIRSS